MGLGGKGNEKRKGDVGEGKGKNLLMHGLGNVEGGMRSVWNGCL